MNVSGSGGKGWIDELVREGADDDVVLELWRNGSSFFTQNKLVWKTKTEGYLRELLNKAWVHELFN